MRHLAWFAALFALSACGSVSPRPSATLILNDPTWDRGHVEAVVTKSPDCDNREAYVSTQDFIMTKNKTHRIEAPNAENIGGLHVRQPHNLLSVGWSFWLGATMGPRQGLGTDL